MHATHRCSQHTHALRVVVRHVGGQFAAGRRHVILPAAMPEVLQAARLSGLDAVKTTTILCGVSPDVGKRQQTERSMDHTTPLSG